MVKDKKKTKAELILVTGLVIVAVCIYLYLHFVGAVKGAKVQILVDGVVTQEYDLYSNQTVAIETENGGQNILVIDNGECYLDDANCPDKLCVSQGIISKSGQSIICLPHKVVITIEGANEAEVDTIAK